MNYFITAGTVFTDYRFGIQLEVVSSESDPGSDYITPKSKIISIPIRNAGYRLPSGLSDKIYLKDGHIYMLKKTGVKILDETNN